MGLAMCKILVENKLNGTITASNSEVGAIFKIDLKFH